MKFKRTLSLTLILLALLPLVPSEGSPLTNDQIRRIQEIQDSINRNQKSPEDKNKDLETQRQELRDKQSQVNTIDNEISEVQRKINDLEQKIQALNNDISIIMVRIDEINVEISKVEAELKVAMDKYNAILISNENRVRELYKSGYKSSIVQLVFSSEDINDFFDNILISSKIVAFDKRMLGVAEEAKREVEAKREEVQKLKDEVLAELEILNGKKNELNSAQDAFEEAKKEAEVRKAQAEVEKDAVYQQLTEAEKEYRVQEAVKKNAQNELITYERSLFEGIYSTAKSTGNKSSLETSISALEAIKNQLTTDTALKEISDAIKNSKNRLSSWGTPPPDSGGSGGSLSDKRSQLIAFAYTMIGTPYVWGGASWADGGFDCSGYVQYVYRQFGYRISRTTYTQINDGIEVSRADLQIGDLVFPHDGHVGMYVGNGQFIHAPQTGERIKVAPIPKFWRARRIIY